MTTTLPEMLAARASEAPAIGAPGRAVLSYSQLQAHSAAVAAQLGARGVGPADRVAIVVPNGPAMASAFVAVAGACTAAPLNPAYKAPEFEFYLSDLKPSAVIVAADFDSPVRDVARDLGVAIIELEEDRSTAAGLFTLSGDGAASAGAAPESGVTAATTALVLHTSGTTSRPKIVPLSHANLLASTRHIGAALALEAGDHCLNVMPLFHIHGLVAAVLTSLAHGARVSCAPDFSATGFFGWCDELTPTWYTAVPTMHQMILARAGRNREIIERVKLRLIRSSSASLPAPVMKELEETFGCPVIESYGMTEAAHQMTSNPLPPAARKPGSVGCAAGPEVAAVDSAGRPVAPGEEGEIAISGDNVTAGYDANPEANATAFFVGEDGRRWFRTGDLGVFDDDGYLRISGRLKEIINRGGEKIAPREVDDVLMEHPAVEQAVAFAVAHPKLGEDIAAVIVLREGERADEATLREFAAANLAGFKVPRRIVFVDAIPKGSTGKLQRIGLAARLGLE